MFPGTRLLQVSPLHLPSSVNRPPSLLLWAQSPYLQTGNTARISSVPISAGHVSYRELNKKASFLGHEGFMAEIEGIWGHSQVPIEHEAWCPG